MENTEGSEGTPTKISDSGYSNSCGNSQSQRSGSSKSRHSGSNSSGSSGYGGKASSSLTNSNESLPQPLSKHKELKKKKNKGPTASTSSNTTESSNDRNGSSRNISTTQERTVTEDDNVTISSLFILPSTTQQHTDDFNKDCLTPRSIHSIHEIQNNKNGEDETLESTAIVVSTTKAGDAVSLASHSAKYSDDEFLSYSPSKLTNDSYYMNKDKLPVVRNTQTSNVGFSCVISMSDGIILYTNSSVNQALGYPKDMLLGKSFIDFVHPKDRNTFGSHITSGVALPLTQSPASNKAGNEGRSTLFCRVRRYRGLRSSSGNSTYGVRERDINYTPFRLDFSFKEISEAEISGMYLIITAAPIASPYIDSKDLIERFTTRHTSSGIISHVNPEAVGFLGYLPQDIIGRCIFDFYHPEDMVYLKEVYENITKRGCTYKSKSYRFRTQNGDYLTIESDWSSFINPWSRKLEFVIGHHRMVYGPLNTDVFQRIKIGKKFPEEVLKQSRMIQDDILKTLNEMLIKQSEPEKQSISKKCKDLAVFMEGLNDAGLKSIEELHIEIPKEKSLSERDSVMLGEISPHHDYYDSKSSTETPPSYNQLNYSENLQRFFESYPCTSQRLESPELKSTSFSENYQSSSEYFMPENNRNFVSPDGQASEKTKRSAGDSRNEGCYSRSPYQSQYANISPPKTPINQMFQGNDYIPIYLTQDLLTKHNSLMEKMLVKKHKVARSVSKAEEKEKCKRRVKNKNNNSKNSTLHRNTFMAYPGTSKNHGVKRPNCATWDNETDSHKIIKQGHVIQPMQHSFNSCQIPSETSGAQCGKKKSNKLSVTGKKNKSLAKKHFSSGTSSSDIRNKNKLTTATTTSSLWPPFSMSVAPIAHPVPSYTNTMSAYSTMYLIPTQQRTVPPEVPTIPKPVEYPFQYLMYPQTMFNSQPLMYPHVAPAYPSLALSNATPTPIVNPTNVQPLGLTTSNYKQACQIPLSKPTSSNSWNNSLGISRFLQSRMNACMNRRATPTDTSLRVEIGSGVGSIGTNFTNTKTEATPSSTQQTGRTLRNFGSEGLDEENSSYSSFFSSLFKTDASNSIGNTDSGEEPANKLRYSKFHEIYKGDRAADINYSTKTKNETEQAYSNESSLKTVQAAEFRNCLPQRPFKNPQSSWIDSVCVTTELINKYRIESRNADDVLKKDMIALEDINQPNMVNEQLSQLYVDLKHDGLPSHLKIEEGITSSSSEEDQSKIVRRKRKYSKLVMIYEEDAPIPSPLPVDE